MRLDIEIRRIVRIAQCQGVFFLITQDGNRHAVDVLALVSPQVGVGIGRLHHVDGRHQARMLVGRIAIDDDVLDDGAELYVTALFQPLCNATAIQVVDGQAFVVQQQRNEFVDIVGYEVALGVHHEAMVFQQRRRDIYLDVLPLEPAFHLVISPTTAGVDGGQALNNHLHAVREFVDTRQTTFVLLAHHHTLVLAQRVLPKPQCHQRQAQRIVVCCRRYLHLSVNHVAIHLRSGIDRRSSLGGTVQPLVVLQETGDTEVTEHQFFVVLIAKQVVTRFDILVNDIVLVAIRQGCCSLQGNTAELSEVAVELIIRQTATLQILHEFVVAVLAFDVGLAVVGHVDQHFKAEILDDTHQFLFDDEVRIIDLQHPQAFHSFYEEHLRLSRVVAQGPDGSVHPAFQREVSHLTVHLHRRWCTRLDGTVVRATRHLERFTNADCCVQITTWALIGS